MNLLRLFLCFLLVVSCTSEKSEKKSFDFIRMNQLGFYPSAIKQFVLADVEGSDFKVVSREGDVKYEGKLEVQGIWEASGERVFLGDFSELKEEGAYTILVNDTLKSYEFEIKKNVYNDALKASTKSFYFQRASMAIAEVYGGKYQRAAGHPDHACSMHPSSGKTEGTWDASGGWYDAGDYGKYVVNGALSVGQMLSLTEKFPDILEDGSLNIPESGNGVNDLLDELKYELDWILKMQDEDGGVFFKLTAKNFSGMVMPDDYHLERFIIGKSTVSSLNFAGVLAQASRIYSFDEEWSNKALTAAKRAWDWAIENPMVAFKNPKDVSTGEYGDNYAEDDFYWAASELFITTGDEVYLQYLNDNPRPVAYKFGNSWSNFVQNNAFHSLLLNQEKVPNELFENIQEGQLALANQILSAIESNPYRIGLNEFVWGSNSDILNQAYILCVAHYLTQDYKYLQGAIQMTDYIFGKNATGYCFLTGFGSKQVMHPHHRPSHADKVVAPVPGFIAGGPNAFQQDGAHVKYQSDFPAKSYEDVMESYASNEVCLNWNAPAVFVLGYLELHTN